MVESRLVRVYLPGVEVEDERLIFFFVDTGKHHSCEPIREESEIPASGNRDFSAHKQ